MTFSSGTGLVRFPSDGTIVTPTTLRDQGQEILAGSKGQNDVPKQKVRERLLLDIWRPIGLKTRLQLCSTGEVSWLQVHECAGLNPGAAGFVSGLLSQSENKGRGHR